MSFVGPRPDLPIQIKNLKKKEAEMRLSLWPGLTGLAQVEGRSNLTYLERLYFDLIYIKQANLKNDLKIIWKTIKQIFKINQVR
jgi:lipopolysaccharide/colanic/teichoic acid biosynthesis glycosyltransferase